jgi:uncharacterized ferritin-like protein (DUF455 family)
MNSDSLHHALRDSARQAFVQSEPALKVDAVLKLQQGWQQNLVRLDAGKDFHAALDAPGRPQKPELVSPLAVRKRAMNTSEGRAVLIHALAHIEFNAINLALDAVWRFSGMPRDYYADWLRVAAEEAYHFTLLNDHLRTLGYSYGDFPAHNSLWEMAEKTRGDILARIALVPRTMEARGLDATPALRAKLEQAGDKDAAAILDIILRDEIGHVAIGNRWFNYLCSQRGLEPEASYQTLAQLYKAPALRGPFNIEARRAAGFSESELARLTGIPAG